MGRIFWGGRSGSTGRIKIEVICRENSFSLFLSTILIYFLLFTPLTPFIIQSSRTKPNAEHFDQLSPISTVTARTARITCHADSSLRSAASEEGRPYQQNPRKLMNLPLLRPLPPVHLSNKVVRTNMRKEL